MVKFLEDLLYPLILLTDIHQVKDFVAQHGVSIFTSVLKTRFSQT